MVRVILDDDSGQSWGIVTQNENTRTADAIQLTYGILLRPVSIELLLAEFDAEPRRRSVANLAQV